MSKKEKVTKTIINKEGTKDLSNIKVKNKEET